MEECGVYLQYRKVVKDPGMTTDLVGMHQRCVEWMHCPSSPASPNASDDEGPVSNKDTLVADITGLFGLVYNTLGQMNAGNHLFDDGNGSDGEI